MVEYYLWEQWSWKSEGGLVMVEQWWRNIHGRTVSMEHRRWNSNHVMVEKLWWNSDGGAVMVEHLWWNSDGGIVRVEQ